MSEDTCTGLVFQLGRVARLPRGSAGRVAVLKVVSCPSDWLPDAPCFCMRRSKGIINPSDVKFSKNGYGQKQLLGSGISGKVWPMFCPRACSLFVAHFSTFCLQVYVSLGPAADHTYSAGTVVLARLS